MFWFLIFILEQATDPWKTLLMMLAGKKVKHLDSFIRLAAIFLTLQWENSAIQTVFFTNLFFNITIVLYHETMVLYHENVGYFCISQKALVYSKKLNSNLIPRYFISNNNENIGESVSNWICSLCTNAFSEKHKSRNILHFHGGTKRFLWVA